MPGLLILLPEIHTARSSTTEGEDEENEVTGILMRGYKE